MIQRSRLIFCLFALILVGTRVTSQVPLAEDFQQWTNVVATWRLRPKLMITAFGEVHIGNDISQFDQEVVSARVSYSPKKWVYVATGYLYVHANPKLSGINYENRIYGDVTFIAPAFHELLLPDRVQPELRWVQTVNEAMFTQRYRKLRNSGPSNQEICAVCDVGEVLQRERQVVEQNEILRRRHNADRRAGEHSVLFFAPKR